MTALEIIDRQIKLWTDKLHRAEGKYHTGSVNMDERARTAAFYQCQRCQTVLTVLEGIRDEIREVL